MSWKIDSQYLDSGSRSHVVRLIESASGVEHIVQILLGAGACPLCGRGRAPGWEPDAEAEIAGVIRSLEAESARLRDYAQKHNLKVK